MTKKDKTGTQAGAYLHYRRQSDGSLKLVGTVAYRHDVEPAAAFDYIRKEVPHA